MKDHELNLVCLKWAVEDLKAVGCYLYKSYLY